MVSLPAACGNRRPLKPEPSGSCFCSTIAVLVNHRVRQLQFTEPQRRFTCLHPSSLSLAWGPLMTNVTPWALTLASDPLITEDAWRVWEQALDTSLNVAFLPHHSISATSCRTHA